MARTNASLDLSKLFDDDDSEGHRLVEFIQNKRGGVKKQNFLFMNYEPPRLSLNVQLEKLPNLELQPNVHANENQKDNVGGESKENMHQKNLLTISPGKVGCNAHSSSVPVDRICPSSPSEHRNSLSTGGTREPSNEHHFNPSSLRLISPRFAAIRKCGVSHSDRLRRYSLKRQKKLCSGRRTLLQEFESTVNDNNFDPTVFSTPLLLRQPDNPPLSVIPTETDNIGQNVKEIGVTSKSCCTHTDNLIKSLQRKDEELQNYMANVDKTIKNMNCTQVKCNKNVTDNTKTRASPESNLKRTYTVEKGNTPGQVVLTPNKNIAKNTDNDQSELLNTSQISPSNIFISQTNNTSSPNLGADKCQNQSKLHTGSKMLKICSPRENQQVDSLNPAKLGTEVSNTQQTNMSVLFCMQEVEVQQTQNLSNVIIQSNVKTPVVVIPINQTYNRISEGKLSSRTIVTSSKQEKCNSHTLPVQPVQQTAKANCSQLMESNLKLSDIFTDDEDETPKSGTLKSNSQAPLNLAKSAANLRKKRLRKRSFPRRKLQMDSSQLLSTESEITKLNPDHSKRRMTQIKYIPLNKAPGIPLNGEEFAQELTRMSNYEILDLRKRNSMGQIFTISGRKTRYAHESAVIKKQQLDNEIAKEIKRRKQLDVTDNQKLQDNPDIVCERNVDEPLPVPDKFRDPLTIQEKFENSLLMSPLIDEKSSDRVSFKIKQTETKSSKLKKNPMPEVLQQYLEVSKRLPLNKNRKNSNNFKRSLYSQDQYEMEENNNITENAILEKNSVSLPCVPSPPKSDVGLHIAVEVVSPPPPLNPSPQAPTDKQQQEHMTSEVEVIPHNANTDLTRNFTELTPAPPPGFENDSSISANNNKRSTTSSSPLRPVQSSSKSETTTNSTTNSDGHLFKIPKLPAPKRNVRKQKAETPLSNGLLESKNSLHSKDSSSDSTGPLRRSKRSHVPLNYSVSIFGELFAQVMRKRLEYLEKKKEKEKQQRKEISKSNMQNRKKNYTVKSTKSQMSRKSPKSGITKKLLPTVLENVDSISSPHHETEILNERKKKGSRLAKNKNNSKEVMKTNENVDSRHLIPNSSPPVEHLNNIFDQLRNAPSTLNARPKIKSFKIRVARLKPASQSNGRCNSVCSSTSSSTTGTNSNSELVTWLKSVRESDLSMIPNEDIFKEMKFSPACNLCFTELQGVEYAFYDADEKACLGYLRFKPRQIKPKKRAKRFHLNFVTLVGNFRITANDKEKLMVVGDLVVISKLAYYEIENLTDDIAILMVVKKE